MKKFAKIATLTAALALATSVAQAAEKIGYVNPNYLVQNHPLLTDPNAEFVKAMNAHQAQFADEEKKLAEVEKQLVEEGQKLQAEGQKLDESLKKKSEALEKEAPRLRSADIKKRQDAIAAEANAFQKKIDALQKREQEFRTQVEAFQKKLGEAQAALGEKQAKVQQEVVGLVEKAIKDAAKAKGYTLVLDSTAVMYTENEGNELTEEIYKTFPKPVAK